MKFDYYIDKVLTIFTNNSKNKINKINNDVISIKIQNGKYFNYN